MARWRLRSKQAQPLGVFGKIVASLILGVFLAAGLGFFGLLSGEIWAIGQTYFWPSVECRITHSSVETGPSSSQNPYAVIIRFEYRQDGKARTAETWRLKPKAFGSIIKAQALADRYPVDRIASCYVNPKRPDQAILERDSLWMAFFLIIPTVFILVGAGGIIAVWTVIVSKEKPGRPQGPITETVATTGGKCVALILFGAFSIGGSVGAYFLLVRPVWKMVDARQWPEVECMVESSRVKSHRGDDGTTFSVDILYRYEFGGKEYRSDRYTFMSGSSSGRAGKAEVVRRYPAGAKAVCYVNPQNPSESVLVRKFSALMLFGLIPLVFVAIGVGGLIFGFRSKTTSAQPWLGGTFHSPTAASTAWPSPPSGGAAPTWDASQPGLGPVTLKPTIRPWAKLAGVIVVAAFWNGIVSVFLWQVVQAWSSDRSGFMEKWFLPLFLVPFVLIGLGLIGAIVYFALAMFNPRPRVTINSLALPLGSAIELSWVMEGRIHVIQRLRLSLQGREEAHYRRGTRSHVDKESFADWEMTVVTSHADIRSGQVRFAIPPNTMHSLDTGNNKILWHVLVHGVIKGWPDVKEEFAVQVMPAPTSNPPIS